MEKIILGLLMLRGMSIYEIKAIVDKKLSTMYSNSTGSIYTAVRQLLKKGCIACASEERKKVYYITSLGRSDFFSWIAQPMNHNKVKNIEISKIFFMGMVENSNITDLINTYLEALNKELSIMQAIMEASSSQKEQILVQSKALVMENKWNEEGLKKTLLNRTVTQALSDIYTYQLETLQYAIDSLQFEISWYKDFLKRRANKNNI